MVHWLKKDEKYCLWVKLIGSFLKSATKLTGVCCKLTVVSLLTTSIECSDISMLTSTEKYLET